MAEPPRDLLFPSQPSGFTALFFTELWERFSYYGMRAILVLFLVEAVASGGFGLDDATATAIYGLYSAGVYIMSMPGGWVADRLIGAQRAVLWGGSIIAIGHLLLGLAGWSDSARMFALGLVALVLGTGLLKPNVSALVGQLHDVRGGTGASRDAGFTWFYIGINIGASLGPWLVGLLRVNFGWHVGFLAAAVGMVAGLLVFTTLRNSLGNAGREPGGGTTAQRRHDWRKLLVGVAVVVAAVAVCITGLVPVSPVAMRDHAALVIVCAVAAWFLYLLFFAGLDASERRGVMVLLVLVLASTLFWAGYEQAGSSLTLFAERHTSRVILGHEFPPEWFQSVPAVFVIAFGLLFAMLWAHLAKRGRDLNLVMKFSLGLLGMGLGFLVMAGAARVIAHEVMGAAASAGPIWLITTYLLHTLGELCLSPVGLSATTQLAPKRFAGQAMGLWFTSLAMGNLFASQLAGSVDGESPRELGAYFLRMFEFGAAGAVLLAILSPWLSRWAKPKQ
jgi:POT family proton-dependent oligopeptide transporter